MRLDELLDGAQASIEISSLAYDSRRVQPGALFFCVSGLQRDGHEFAAQAVSAGAAALVVERPLALKVPQVRVESVRAAMGPIAARFYSDPTAQLRVIGVTGTNGKTTSAYLVRALVEACGERCGLLGTVGSVIAGEQRAAVRTTPEAIDLQANFREMLDGGEGACAMEVSSHALALGRTAGVRFAAAIFTNLTQDHLDFHNTMEDYFQAKRLLFVPPLAPGIAVVNIGDPYGRRLAAEIQTRQKCEPRQTTRLVTFGVEQDADYSAWDLRIGFQGTRFCVRTPAGEHDLRLPLPGRFNVQNALGALAAVHALRGEEIGPLLQALQQGVRVPGRFESVEEGQQFAVVVDYAHTPDSLQNVLLAARELAAERAGRVLCVFGAGGDRDRGKRPLMGQAVAQLADVAIVTSDNPRSEDPAAIVEEIVAGMRECERTTGMQPEQVELDRRRAIEQAIEQARPGDVLVIAGKGHEQGQELAHGRKLPFDDVAVAREALRERARAAVLAGGDARVGETRAGGEAQAG